MGSTLGRLTLAALALLLLPAAAMAAVPIPGVDIIVQKKPGGSARAEALTGANGRFTVRIRVPGDYTISTECRSRSAPRPCPPRTLSVRGPGVTLRRRPDGGYDFTVARNRPVVLTGLVETIDAGPVVADYDGDSPADRATAEPAPGDIDGDGRADRAAPEPPR